MIDKKNTEKLIKKEYKIVKEEPFPSLGISMGLPDKNNYFRWNIIIFGPDDSIYAGGIFKMKIIFEEEFPLTMPKVKFVTKIYHCNVSDEGDVRIPSLQKWNDNISMSQVLSDIFSLFYVQNPDKEFNSEISDIYVNNRQLFESKAKKFTKDYASS